MFEYANENESETNKRHLQSDAECRAMAMTKIQQSGNQFTLKARLMSASLSDACKNE